MALRCPGPLIVAVTSPVYSLMTEMVSAPLLTTYNLVCAKDDTGITAAAKSSANRDALASTLRAVLRAVDFSNILVCSTGLIAPPMRPQSNARHASQQSYSAPGTCCTCRDVCRRRCLVQ